MSWLTRAWANRTPSPVESLLSDDLTAQVERALSGLSEKEAQILRLRFGIGEEGEDALSALRLERREHAQIETPAPSVNDAADDLLRPEPPIEPDPQAPMEDGRRGDS